MAVQNLFNLYNDVFDKIKTVNIEIDSYSGKYYEVMRMPTSFQDDSTSSTAEYTKINDSTIKVFNTSYINDFQESVDDISGYAVLNTGESGKLSVFFPSNVSQYKAILSIFGIPDGFPAPYWVIETGSILTNQPHTELNGKYEYAIVTSPGKTFCWVLARSKPQTDTFTRYVPILESLGFKGKKFVVPYAKPQGFYVVI